MYAENTNGTTSLESEIAITPATTVTKVALPERPYCLRLTPNHNSTACTILEATSHQQQDMWLHAFEAEIAKASA